MRIQSLPVRRVFVLVAAVMLASCVSAPPRHSAHKPIVAKAAYQVKAAAPGSALHVCPGRVSNAPVTNEKRKIVNYDPVAQVSGVALTRAPVQSCVSSGYGPRRGGASSFHSGVDLYTKTPKPIYASGSGVIENIGTRRSYGRTILIRHKDSVKTRYAHLSSYAPGLKIGSRVRRGDLIGYTGDTGNATAVHLHYEVLVNGKRRDPLSVGS